MYAFRAHDMSFAVTYELGAPSSHINKHLEIAILVYATPVVLANAECSTRW